MVGPDRGAPARNNGAAISVEMNGAANSPKNHVTSVTSVTKVGKEKEDSDLDAKEL
jgi:hypothetical protein